MPRASSKLAASATKGDHLTLPPIGASKSEQTRSPRADHKPGAASPRSDARHRTANLRPHTATARPGNASFRPTSSPGLGEPTCRSNRHRPGTATAEAAKKRGRKHCRRSSSLGDLPTFAGLAAEVAGIADALERSLEELNQCEKEGLCDDTTKVAATLSTDCMLPSRVKYFAHRHGLDVTEMDWVLQCLRTSDINLSDGGMTLDSFEEFILRAFQIPEVEHKIIANAYITLNAGVGAFDMDEFFVWYKQNAFAISGAAAKFTRKASEIAVDALAKQLDVNIVELLRIRRKYKEYDSDNSGAISFEEFHSLMKQILGMSASDSIQKDRLDRFWAEANPDGDSKIDFQEFVSWYIHYFKSAFKDKGAFENDPATAFYASYLPQAQRHEALTKRNHGGHEEKDTSSVVSKSSPVKPVSQVPLDDSASLQPHPPASPSGGRPHRRPHAPDSMAASRSR
eukprot:TRINITY_DN103986_c0_g1_i1.p1 TRINITY_DN103986_c0_g1~~TRINITY_DN103986_c0_g1_i1.p1  ORF type:complete len:455 (+),score=77.76 TRINITY_DN103986_c0_g1_i1:74-1438(+)